MPSGGRREGAGRPRAITSVLRDRKVVERRLKLAAEDGWEVLADSYTSLIRKAVDVALGEGGAPNIVMLKTLVELMIKIVGSEPDQSDSVMKQLVERFIDRHQNTTTNSPDRPALDDDRAGRVEHVDSRYDTRAESNSALPGMGGRFSINGVD